MTLTDLEPAAEGLVLRAARNLQTLRLYEASLLHTLPSLRVFSAMHTLELHGCPLTRLAPMACCLQVGVLRARRGALRSTRGSAA